ncbi:MAG: hypothetical protein IJZ70_04215 [Bacteroidales bacterium]|nr:hypothetical protein [Bacteroidales bacterium]
MKTLSYTYISPEVTVMALETESYLMASSSLGGNDELLEDPNDYVDFFE